MNLKAVLIDDEDNNLANLGQLLKTYCPSVTVLATASGATEGKAAIDRFQPDLVFLDIQMPGKTGFDLLKELHEYPFEVIFVTAFDQYAIQAVRFSAVDYLLKPVNIGELKSAVERATVRHSQKKQNRQLANLIDLLQLQRTEHRIALTTLKETRFIKTSDIVRCESSNNYTAFMLSAGEKITVSRPIYEYEELLKDYGFIRCHQSHLVNRNHIKSFRKEDGGYLLLDDHSAIPVSRSKKEEILKILAS